MPMINLLILFDCVVSFDFGGGGETDFLVFLFTSCEYVSDVVVCCWAVLSNYYLSIFHVSLKLRFPRQHPPINDSNY